MDVAGCPQRQFEQSNVNENSDLFKGKEFRIDNDRNCGVIPRSSLHTRTCG